jgi:hypothetical protein
MVLAIGPLALPAGATAFDPGYPQVRVTVAGGCPVTVARDQDVDNPTGPFTRLVPSDPIAGRICRYGPRLLSPSSAGESSAGLYRDTPLDGASARRLAVVIDRLPTNQTIGVTSCPADFGSVTVIALSYRHRPDADLWYHDGGCESLDNGHLRSFELGNRAFYEGFGPLVDRLSPPTPSGLG